MMTFWMKTVNIDKALESHISEILETLDKDYHDWWLIQTKFFQQQIFGLATNHDSPYPESPRFHLYGFQGPCLY